MTESNVRYKFDKESCAIKSALSEQVQQEYSAMQRKAEKVRRRKEVKDIRRNDERVEKEFKKRKAEREYNIKNYSRSELPDGYSKLTDADLRKAAEEAVKQKVQARQERRERANEAARKDFMERTIGKDYVKGKDFHRPI